MSVSTALMPAFARLNGVRMGRIMATTASSGTPSHIGVITRLPRMAMTVAATALSTRPMTPLLNVRERRYTSAAGRMKPVTTRMFMMAPEKSAMRMPWMMAPT